MRKNLERDNIKKDSGMELPWQIQKYMLQKITRPNQNKMGEIKAVFIGHFDLRKK